MGWSSFYSPHPAKRVKQATVNNVMAHIGVHKVYDDVTRDIKQK